MTQVRVRAMGTEKRKAWTPKCEKFEDYYKQQQIVPDEEWPQFMATLKSALPITFRITGTLKDPITLATVRKVKELVNAIKMNLAIAPETDFSRNLQAPRSLSWSDDLIWQFDGSHCQFRGKEVKQQCVPRGDGDERINEASDDTDNKIEDNKGNGNGDNDDEDENDDDDDEMEGASDDEEEANSSTPTSNKALRRAFRKLHIFVLRETRAGNISRQEVVSMLPPLLLRVEPHHSVLDMCAAPGSKTLQLLEEMSQPSLVTSSSSPLEHVSSSSFLLANDADYKRCFILLERTKKQACPFLMVTHGEANNLPDHLGPFDRILCDVPCSGDGTLRKELYLWSKWAWTRGPALHGLQTQILQRGCDLLKPGGRIVYSTCSLNPMENEAVVHAVLQTRDDMTVVQCADALKGFRHRTGLSSWLVRREKGFVSKIEDVSNGRPAKRLKLASLFPPSAESPLVEQLRRCSRFLPHLENTGGFFIAVLEKKADLTVPIGELVLIVRTILIIIISQVLT
jgi:16S rRNA C967 or C1407 C5-methylase (RsmB/RsmF family)